MIHSSSFLIFRSQTPRLPKTNPRESIQLKSSKDPEKKSKKKNESIKCFGLFRLRFVI